MFVTLIAAIHTLTSRLLLHGTGVHGKRCGDLVGLPNVDLRAAAPVLALACAGIDI